MYFPAKRLLRINNFKVTFKGSSFKWISKWENGIKFWRYPLRLFPWKNRWADIIIVLSLSRGIKVILKDWRDVLRGLKNTLINLLYI